MRNETEQFIYLKDYAPAQYEISHVNMSAVFGPQTTCVVTQLSIVPAAGTQAGAPLLLDGEDLEFVSLALDGVTLKPDAYEVRADGLTLLSPPAGPFKLTTEVSLTPQTNTKLMGLYRSSGVWCTQCEPEGFRRITYYLDRPDVLATFRVRMEADAAMAPVLLANGNRVEHGTLDGERHFAVWEDPHPKPAYLFAMVAGDLGVVEDHFTTASGRKVALGIYCEHGKQDQCGYALDALKRSMAWDERRFGREYDLDVFNIVAVSDFNFGAMENKGLNIFNDRFVLAKPETATDADYANIERIIAHEYFHNWTGNRITCRDWFQLCLKEGLTVYRDQEFTSDERSRAVQRIEDVRGLRAAQFPEDGGPLAHPARPTQYSEINNFYTATVYQKGAEIVRMLATLLGESEFRAGTDLYFERHDGEATTIEAWLKVFEDATGRDLSAFGKWYTQAGTPEVNATTRWDAANQSYHLTLTQHVDPTPGQADKAPMVMPVKFGLVGANGHDMDWQSVSGAEIDASGMMMFDTPKAEISFTGLAGKPVASLFRGFSAPIKLSTDTGADEKLFLARQDSDPFNRWQALQDIAMAIMVEAVREGGDIDGAAADALAEALGDTLDNEALDDAFKAHALSLPGEMMIAQTLERDIDPARVHEVRKALQKRLAVHLQPRLSAVYKQLATVSTPYSIVAAATRARALRNQCLSLLAATGTEAGYARIEAHYGDADNMTDLMAALGTSVATGAPMRDDLLADFKSRFEAEPLVMDKWLALHASRSDDGCLEGVRALFEAPDFAKTNPNRLRALIGVFAAANPVQFSAPDGSGFRFVTAACHSIDSANPQVAARILTAFRSWASYEPVRKTAARAALESLAKVDGLSRNVTDILTRTLST